MGTDTSDVRVGMSRNAFASRELTFRVQHVVPLLVMQHWSPFVEAGLKQILCLYSARLTSPYCIDRHADIAGGPSPTAHKIMMPSAS